jgi:hypothetical protein
MIVEFQLSLEGQATRWYAQQEISTFITFQDLVDKFLEMFQVKIDPIEVLKEYCKNVRCGSRKEEHSRTRIGSRERETRGDTGRRATNV